VVPQDIGRVLLNLFNNAFQAVNGYADHPVVKVSTHYNGNSVEIRVSDNGPGIPDAIKDKIFQPFFTTKPAGQGTGLGLSLSYEIVKAHGGELKVEAKEGEETTFIIQLPA
jgi:two-component system, NtrC family, sensor kinase